MSEIVSLNGEWLSVTDASVAIDDRGFLLGDGVFETLRFDQNTSPYFLQHWQRLQHGCEILAIPFLESPESVLNQLKTLLQKNDLTEKLAAARITVTRGCGPRGLTSPKPISPTILIRCFELQPKTQLTISVMHSDVVINERSPLRQFKSLNYAENIIARERAVAAGFDDALLYNTKGHLVGTTCANVFLKIDGALLTPSLESGALPGIMRQQILDSSKQTGMNALEALITRADCELATAAFITNSLIRITPVNQIDKALSFPSPAGVRDELVARQ